MFLKSLNLQNFRSYKKSEFTLNNNITFIIGPNTSGKTNLVEAIFLLSSGKSFRADKDFQMIGFDSEIARVKGETTDAKLEVMITNGQINGVNVPFKKYLVNGVSRRRVDFSSNLNIIIFSPEDLDIIVDSPSLRRRFLDDILEQVDRDYRVALTTYTKGLRQRNALLEKAKEEGVRQEKQFEYWDNVLIKNGQDIAKKREEFIEYVNLQNKDIFDFAVIYDKSVISKERLLKYKEAELGSGVTLVGPHRDDFLVEIFDDLRQTTHNVRFFGSRGQQRLIILQLKLLELAFVEQKLGHRPIFVLDDIFSELDEGHIKLVLEMVGKQQTIITTTHKEFIPQKLIEDTQIIELSK